MSKNKVRFLGENLLQFRKEKGLSQEELANKIGVSRQAVYKWETTSKMPDIENLILLCKEFDKNIEDFVEGAELLTGKKEKNSVEKKINFKKVILIFLFIILSIYIISVVLKSFFFGMMFSKINKIKDSINYSYVNTYINNTIDDGENRKTYSYINYRDGVQVVESHDNDYCITDYHYTWDVSQENNKMQYTIKYPLEFEDESQIEYFCREGFEYSEDSPYELIIEYAKEFYSIKNILNPFKILNFDFENKDLIFEIYSKDTEYDKITYVKKIVYIDIESGLLSKIEYYQLNELKQCLVYYDYKFNQTDERILIIPEELKIKCMENSIEY